METMKKLSGVMVALLIAGKLCGQSNQYYGGVDLTTMGTWSGLPLASARALGEYAYGKKQLIPTDSATYRNRLKNSNIPADFEETYYSNNWLQLATYSYLEPEEFRYMNAEGFHYHNPKDFHYRNNDLYESQFIITDRKLGDIKLQLCMWHDGIVEPYLETTNGGFDNDPSVFVKKGDYTYQLCHDGDNKSDDYSLIVDYRDGIMFIEYTYTGKVGDFNSKRRFRNAYLAIPKSLANSTQTSNVSTTPDVSYGSSVPNMNTSPIIIYGSSIPDMNSTPHIYYGSSAPDANSTAASSAAPYVSPQGTDLMPIQPVLHFNENQLIGGEAANNLRDAYFTYRDYVPPADSLKNMRTGKPVSPGIAYDIYDFDWMEMARYEWFNGERYVINTKNLDLVRFHPQAGTYDFSLSVKSQNDEAQLRYLENWNRDVTTVMKQGNFTYLAVNGTPAMTVLCYTENILIVDQKDPVSGEVMRIVYAAMPRQF